MEGSPLDSGPAAEALRRMADERIEESKRPQHGATAKAWIAVLALVWLPAQLLAVLVALLTGPPQGEDSLWVLFVLIPFAIPAAAASGAALVVTLRHWSSLSGAWIVLGIVPWLVFAAGAVATLAAAY